MALKLITCDLHGQSPYTRVLDTVRSFGDTVKLSDDSFVVDTKLTTDQVLAKLLKVIDLEDHVYVLELSRAWAGYGEIKVNNFLAGHLSGHGQALGKLSLHGRSP